MLNVKYKSSHGTQSWKSSFIHHPICLPNIIIIKSIEQRHTRTYVHSNNIGEMDAYKNSYLLHTVSGKS